MTVEWIIFSVVAVAILALLVTQPTEASRRPPPWGDGVD